MSGRLSSEEEISYIKEEEDDEQESENELEHVKETVVESNAVCAIFLCISAIAFDALFALPGAVLDDVPASLRTTSICLCVLLGAPPITKDSAFILEQRAVIGVLLTVAAFVGMNRGETTARNSDAIFCIVSTFASAVASATNGVNTQADTSSRKNLVREHLTSFVAALLFYIGLRNLRHSLALPVEVTSFSVSHSDIKTRGYAVANEVITTCNAFCGALTIAFAVICLLNFDIVLKAGSTSVSKIAGSLACFVFAGAFVAQLAFFESFSYVPALFGDNACNSVQNDCDAAFRARRLFVCSNTPAISFVSAAALATFSFSYKRAVSSRKQHFSYAADLYSVPYVSVLVSSIVSILAVLFYSDSNGFLSSADAELLLLLVSIPAVFFQLPFLGCLSHAVGLGLYVHNKFSEGDFEFTYFTHHSLLTSLFLVTVLSVTCATSSILYTFRDQRLFAEPLEALTATFVSALLSIQLFLFLATLAMSSGYSGSYYESGNNWQRQGFRHSTQHSVSFFFAAALYACRYEHASMNRCLKRAAYISVVPIVGTAWWICLLVLTDSQDPYTPYMNIPSFVIGVSSAGVSWLGVGVCIDL